MNSEKKIAYVKQTAALSRENSYLTTETENFS